MDIITNIDQKSQLQAGDINKNLAPTIKYNNVDIPINQIVPDMPPVLKSLLDSSNTPIEVWNSRIAKEYLHLATANWIRDLCSWKHFITLTFKEFRYPDVAISIYKRLVRELNKELFGKHYSNIVGHSYFSYVLGIEFQKRDVVHFHVIADNKLNYSKIHAIWNNLAGFAWIEQIKSIENVSNYVAKYILKSGEMEIYKARKNEFIPKFIPNWWQQQETKKA